MIDALLAQVQLQALLESPATWGLAVTALGLWGMLSAGDRRLRGLGQALCGIGLIILAVALPKLSPLSNFDEWVSQITFWVLAAVAVGCSVAAVTARNPVYTAIWFAGSLLGVSGLFVYQHAQFLGFATIVVYAGAIVVTFLFVLMLANSEGHAMYDRISWAKFPAPLMISASLALVAIIVFSASTKQTDPLHARHTVQSTDHVAHLGGELFARHLVSVEVAGTILLVALVGAIAIVIQGRGETAVTSGEPVAERGRHE
jgi:NADH-quinone oxidoreductase subunit J